MTTKLEFLITLTETLLDQKLADWYTKNLENTKQIDTLTILEKGIIKKEITTKQALAIALLTGYQWNIKFEGTK